jgi:hypothetical protein
VGLIFSLFLGTVSANEYEEGGLVIEITETMEEEDNQESVMTPESPFYALKRLFESFRLMLTFDQEKKVAYLEDLLEERQKELDALERLYNAGEISDEQLTILEKALDDLISFAERLMEEVAKLDENGSEEDLPEGQEGEEVDGDEEHYSEEMQMDKYQWRVAHLQAIADQAPESAQKGLARAMDNAWRQRERAIAKGKLLGDENPLQDENPEEEGEQDSFGTDEEETLEVQGSKNKKSPQGNVFKNKKR